MQPVKRLLCDLFLPNAEMCKPAKVLRHRALFSYSVALVLLKVAVLVAVAAAPLAVVLSSAITPANIISLTNQTRTSLGLNALTEDSRLDAAAQAKADDMILHQYFSHTSPLGVTPWKWIRQAGYNYILAGENLAVHYTSAEALTTGWLASPTHRASITNERFVDVGVGVARGEFEGFNTYVVVQMFGEPIPVPKEEVVLDPVSDPIEPADHLDSPIEEEIVVDETVLGVTETIPEIDDSTLLIIPVKEGFDVSVVVENATKVELLLESESTQLVAKEENGSTVWQGIVEVDEEVIDRSGEPLYASASNAEGSSETESLVLLAPNAQTEDLYGFGIKPKPQIRLFGFFSLSFLDNMTNKIYFFTIVFLAGVLLVSFLRKFNHKNHSTTAHTLLVIILATILVIV